MWLAVAFLGCATTQIPPATPTPDEPAADVATVDDAVAEVDLGSPDASPSASLFVAHPAAQPPGHAFGNCSLAADGSWSCGNAVDPTIHHVVEPTSRVPHARHVPHHGGPCSCMRHVEVAQQDWNVDTSVVASTGIVDATGIGATDIDDSMHVRTSFVPAWHVLDEPHARVRQACLPVVRPLDGTDPELGTDPGGYATTIVQPASAFVIGANGGWVAPTHATTPIGSTTFSSTPIVLPTTPSTIVTTPGIHAQIHANPIAPGPTGTVHVPTGSVHLH